MGAQSGFASTLTIDTVPIGKITGITPPEMSADVIDVTTNDSADGYREFIGGLRDGGEISLEGIADALDAGQEDIRDGLEDGESHAIVITFPDGSSWTASAIVSKFGMGDPMDDKITFSASMKVTGKPVFGS